MSNTKKGAVKKQTFRCIEQVVWDASHLQQILFHTQTKSREGAGAAYSRQALVQ